MAQGFVLPSFIDNYFAGDYGMDLEFEICDAVLEIGVTNDTFNHMITSCIRNTSQGFGFLQRLMLDDRVKIYSQSIKLPQNTRGRQGSLFELLTANPVFKGVDQIILHQISEALLTKRPSILLINNYIYLLTDENKIIARNIVKESGYNLLK